MLDNIIRKTAEELNMSYEVVLHVVTHYLKTVQYMIQNPYESGGKIELRGFFSFRLSRTKIFKLLKTSPTRTEELMGLFSLTFYKSKNEAKKQQRIQHARTVACRSKEKPCDQSEG